MAKKITCRLCGEDAILSLKEEMLFGIVDFYECSYCLCVQAIPDQSIGREPEIHAAINTGIVQRNTLAFYAVKSVIQTVHFPYADSWIMDSFGDPVLSSLLVQEGYPAEIADPWQSPGRPVDVVLIFEGKRRFDPPAALFRKMIEACDPDLVILGVPELVADRNALISPQTGLCSFYFSRKGLEVLAEMLNMKLLVGLDAAIFVRPALKRVKLRDEFFHLAGKSG